MLGYGHFATQCPIQTKTMLVEVLIEEDEEKDGLEVIVYQQDDDSELLLKIVSSIAALELTLALTDLTPNYDNSFRSS